MIYVLDASVLIKWFVEESDSVHALNYRARLCDGGIAVALPDLALYEIGNALRQKRGFPESALKGVFSILLRMGLDIVTPTEGLMRQASHVAFTKNITFYDAAYVALGMELKATLVTADVKLARQAQGFLPIEPLFTIR